MGGTLDLVLILLASSVLAVVAFRSLHLPPLLGYLLVGVAIGPLALGWIPDSEQVTHLAEFGVVFLMFSIGLEFNLPRLRRMRRAVFGLGASQVGFSILVAVGLGTALGFGWRESLAVGGALAMSSTAIVVRMMAERMQLESGHGREVVGVLLFQDLAVVPLLIVIPALAAGSGDLPEQLAAAMVKAALVLTVMLFFGPRLMRAWFDLVARRRSHELFILNVLLMTLGLAWLTERAGLSPALGAFLAGVLIAETAYRQQVEEDIRPFREVLLGLFFITMGMKLDLRVMIGGLPIVLALTLVPVVFKFGLIALLSRLLGSPPGTALRAGLTLAQAGEFGLVLVLQSQSVGLLGRDFTQYLVAAMLLSMLIAPVIIQASDRLVLRWSRSEWMLKSLELHRVAVQGIARERHVIVCGYGRTGQRLAHLLEGEGISYIALDLDPERVREAGSAGESVVYGDASRRETLIAAGLARASAMVITFADTALALRILGHVRREMPALPVIVRTRDDSNLDRLVAAGATEVVPETLESSLMLASHAMVLLGIPLNRVVRKVREVQESRYSLMRGFYHGESDETGDMDADHAPRLRTVALAAGAHAVGRNLGELSLEDIGVSVPVIRRRDVRASAPGPETQLCDGDVLVLLGTPEQLSAAELRLLRG